MNKVDLVTEPSTENIHDFPHTRIRKSKRVIIGAICIFTLTLLSIFIFQNYVGLKKQTPTSYDECIVTEDVKILSGTCITKNGQHFSNPNQKIILTSIPTISSNSPLIPTNSQGDDWQTYEVGTYGFSFKYPRMYTIKSTGPNYTQKRIDRGENELAFRLEDFDKPMNVLIPPPAIYETLIFEGPQPEIVLEIFHKLPSEFIEKLNFSYADVCESQFFPRPIVDRIFTLNNLSIRERQQKSPEDRIFLFNCFVEPEEHLISLSASGSTDSEIKSISDLLKNILSTFKFASKPN